MKKLYYIMLLAVIMISFSACDERDYPYYRYSDDYQLIGSWESYYGHDGYVEYDIMGSDMVRFDFYANHTGRYTYYSYYGLRPVDFDWYTQIEYDRYYDYNILIIHYFDGDSEYLYYDFDRNNLILSTDNRFYQYTAYRPSGYWAPAKEATADDKKLTTNKDMDTSSSRAVISKSEGTQYK